MLNGFDAYNPGSFYPRYEIAYKESEGVPGYSNTQLYQQAERFSPNVFQQPDYGQQPMQQQALQPGMQMQQGFPQQGLQSQGQQAQGLQQQGLHLQGMQAQDMQQQMMPQFISFSGMQPQAQGMQPQVLPQPGIQQQGVKPQGPQHQGIQPQGMPSNISHQAMSQQTMLLQGMPAVSGNPNDSFGNFAGPQGGDDAFMGTMGPSGRDQAQRGPGLHAMGFQTAVTPQLPQQQALHGNRGVSGMASCLEMNAGQQSQSGQGLPMMGGWAFHQQGTGPLQQPSLDNMQHMSQQAMMQHGVPQQGIVQQAPQYGGFFQQPQAKSDQRPGMDVLAQGPVGSGQAGVLPPPPPLPWTQQPQQRQQSQKQAPQQQQQRQGSWQQQPKQRPSQQQQRRQAPQQQQKQAPPQQQKQAPQQQQQKQASPQQQQKQAPPQQQQKQAPPQQQQKQAPPQQQQKQAPPQQQQKQAPPQQQQKQAPPQQQQKQASPQQQQKQAPTPQQKDQAPQQQKQAPQQEQKVQVQKPSAAGTGTAGNSIAESAQNVQQQPQNATSSLYIDGLPPDVTQRELMHIFRPYAGFTGLRLVLKKDSAGRGKLGKAFIDFSDVASATLGLETLSGYRLDVDGQTPYVMRPVYARPPRIPAKGFTSQPTGGGSRNGPATGGNAAKRGSSEAGITGSMSKRAKQLSTGVNTYIEGGFGEGIQPGSRAPPRPKVGGRSTGPGAMQTPPNSRGRDAGSMHGGGGTMFEPMGPASVHPLRQGGPGPEYSELGFFGPDYGPGPGFGPGLGFAPGPGFATEPAYGGQSMGGRVRGPGRRRSRGR